jgi:hypothetical protein
MEETFSTWVVQDVISRTNEHVEAGLNTCNVALRIVGGEKREPCAWEYNRATLFLEDINIGTWSSGSGESRIWDSKIWSWSPRDSNPRMTAIARTSNSCKQTRPLVREGAPHQETRNCLTVIIIWSWAPGRCLTPEQTGRLTVGSNVTLTLTFVAVRSW